MNNAYSNTSNVAGRAPAALIDTEIVQVTQAMLVEYVALSKAARRHRKLRERIVALLEGGAGVEPGARSVTIDARATRRLTKNGLIELIGEDLVDEYMEAIKPSVYRFLDVRTAAESRIDATKNRVCLLQNAV